MYMILGQILSKMTRTKCLHFYDINFSDAHVHGLMLLLFSSYFLERSNSAKMTLSRARELFPIEVIINEYTD